MHEKRAEPPLSGVAAYVLDCNIVANEFELQLPDYVYFRIKT